VLGHRKLLPPLYAALAKTLGNSHLGILEKEKEN
jgi:hypothetical protein